MLTKDEIELVAKKLEYRFKTSDAGKSVIERLQNGTSTQDDLSLIKNKLEYRFKKSQPGMDITEKLV